MTTRTKTAAIVFAILIGIVNAAHGQRTGSGGTIETPKPRSAAPTRTRTDAPARVETRYRVKTVTPTTGQLFVATDPPGTVILIEPLDRRNKDSRQAQIPEDRRDWVFNDLRPGQYRVAATKAEYRQTEKVITIERNKPSRMTLDLEPVLYKVTVKTNVDGELKYGKEGEVLSTRPIQNSITFSLPAGDYVVDLEPAEPVYKTVRHKFSVREDVVVELNLARRDFSRDTLSPQWTDVELKSWEMPSTWYANSGSLFIKGAGVGLPRDESKRFYKDFTVISDIKIANGIGASFVLRAQDKKNFYLLELTGERSDEPFYVRLLVVKNGLEQRVQALRIPNAAAAPLKSGQFFTVQIQVADNRVAVNIVDNQAAMDYPLGILVDANRTFAAGAVGLAARNQEENAVFRFVVCTECPKE